MRFLVTTPDGSTHRVRSCEAAVLLVRRGGVVRKLGLNAPGDASAPPAPGAFNRGVRDQGQGSVLRSGPSPAETPEPPTDSMKRGNE